MPVQNLLDINTDKLFEDFSVSEILETQKKLQTEIEKERNCGLWVGKLKFFCEIKITEFSVKAGTH
jgi:hypothetical protein